MPQTVERFCKDCPYWSPKRDSELKIGYCRIESAKVGGPPFPITSGTSDWCYIIRPEAERLLKEITAR